LSNNEYITGEWSCIDDVSGDWYVSSADGLYLTDQDGVIVYDQDGNPERT